MILKTSGWTRVVRLSSFLQYFRNRDIFRYRAFLVDGQKQIIVYDLADSRWLVVMRSRLNNGSSRHISGIIWRGSLPTLIGPHQISVGQALRNLVHHVIRFTTLIITVINTFRLPGRGIAAYQDQTGSNPTIGSAIRPILQYNAAKRYIKFEK